MAKPDFWGLSVEVFISLAPFGLSTNLMLESVISIFITTTGGELYPKLVKYLWKVENRLRMTFIFSRSILKTVYGQKDCV